MNSLGGTSDGLEYSGLPLELASHRPFKVMRGLDGEVMRDDAGPIRVWPLETELYWRDHDLRIGDFWRWDGLDTPERREGAILKRAGRPPEASVHDRTTGGPKD